jgi:putative SOS response-associated peptidase YedK
MVHIIIRYNNLRTEIIIYCRILKLIEIVNKKEIEMCGRFAQVIKYDQLQKLERELRLNRESDQLIINYNVAPTQPVVAAVSQDSGRYIGTFRWGLIPSWSQELPKFDLINIRSDSLVSKPSFRKGLQYRRCLIPANGFYEWRKSDKQPFFGQFSHG